MVSADLVKIESADENDFVKRLVISHNGEHVVWSVMWLVVCGLVVVLVLLSFYF